MKTLITNSQVSLWLPEHPNHGCLSTYSSLLSSLWRINCLLCWVFITSIVNCHKLCIYYFIVLGSQRCKANITGLIQSVGRVVLPSGTWGFVTLPFPSLEVSRRSWFVLHFPLTSMQWHSILWPVFYHHIYFWSQPKASLLWLDWDEAQFPHFRIFSLITHAKSLYQGRYQSPSFQKPGVKERKQTFSGVPSSPPHPGANNETDSNTSKDLLRTYA